jgi:Universal stress protein family
MPLRRILVAIDGSEPADRALALASALARSAGGGTLILMSAISDPVTFAPTPVAGLELVLEAEQQGAERDLAERAARLREGGVEVETVVRVGPAPDVLVEEAQARRADLWWQAGPGRELSSARYSEVSPPGSPTFSGGRSSSFLIPFAGSPCKVRNPWLPGLS